MEAVRFPNRSAFYPTLRQRVDEYFESNGLANTGNGKMVLKTVIILTWMVTAYTLLVFFSASLFMAIITAFALAQSFVLVGFNIMHDGAHESYSKSRKVNRVMGFTLNLIGGSQMLWRHKHNILHHTYTNIAALDDDLNSDGLLRLSPSQKWRPWHRFQHWYALPVYSLLTISMITTADFRKFFLRRIGGYELPKWKASESVMFFLTKVFYVGYMIVLPAFFHPLWQVLLAFLAVHLILGFTMSVVFQLAHTVDVTEFPEPDPKTGAIESAWAIHQVETTANFAPRNRFLVWYLGGLNHQIEHHLFTKVCHVHYPDISRIVEKTCSEFGVRYSSLPTLRAALGNHIKYLKAMGNPAPAAA